MITLISNFLWGILMAFGELIPGIGMQTVAIIVGIYDEIITFLFKGTEFLRVLLEFIIGKKTKQELSQSFFEIPWKLGIPLVIGVGVTIAVLSRTVTTILEQYPHQFAAVAFGIVLACVAIPFKEMTSRTWKEYGLLIFTFLAFFYLFGLTQQSTGATTSEPALSSFFIGGAVSSFAGFFPGISISFALLVMNLYGPLMKQIDLLTHGAGTLYGFGAIIVFLIGLGIGSIICVRALQFLIERYKSFFLAFIIGLILASLRTVWPFMNNSGTYVLPWELTLSAFTQQLFLIVGAFIAVSFLRLLASQKETSITSSFGKPEKIVIE